MIATLGYNKICVMIHSSLSYSIFIDNCVGSDQDIYFIYLNVVLFIFDLLFIVCIILFISSDKQQPRQKSVVCRYWHTYDDRSSVVIQHCEIRCLVDIVQWCFSSLDGARGERKESMQEVGYLLRHFVTITKSKWQWQSTRVVLVPGKLENK